MQISRTINLISFLFPWVFSTFASIAATLVCSSSVCLPLHAACHPDSAECLWHCHLDVMSYFFPVTQPRCLSTGLSATQQLELSLMYFTDARILFFFFFKKRLGSYNPLNQIRKMNTASYSVTDDHDSVSGWNGKPQAEPGWDSHGGNQRVSFASVC